jgi:two-component system, NtrC family, response regulator AtoC
MTAEKKTGTVARRVDVLPPDDVLFGRSETMKEVRNRATKIAGTNIPVLLCGPQGSGKEVLAKWIHSHSTVSNGQFVKVNCAAIPGTLLESELFGHEKGAFTGAHITRPGRVELAHQGTLFLDEIGDLDTAFQSKLLQFLQDGRFSRIGGQEERFVETRLICATNRDLLKEIDTGTFRADLYYRINVIRIRIPGLRERSEDIPQLAVYFQVKFQEEFGKQAEPLNTETLQYLQNLDWPGNIRELSNGIARYVLIGAESANFQEQGTSRGVAKAERNARLPLKQLAKEVIRDRERDLILDALRSNQWNQRKTAQALRISYRTLIYKIRDAGLVSRRPKELTGSPENQMGRSHSFAD